MRLIYDAPTIHPGASSESLYAWTIASTMVEKYPVTVFNPEAMASGRAVITADWAGPGEAVPADAGMLVSVVDPKKPHLRLAVGLRRLIQDRGMCERMGSVGRHVAERRNAWPVVLANLESVYASVWEGEFRSRNRPGISGVAR